jgi:hypothetical protein
VFVVAFSHLCDGFAYLSLFDIYFPLALFQEEAQSNIGLWDCGGSSHSFRT